MIKISLYLWKIIDYDYSGRKITNGTGNGKLFAINRPNGPTLD